MDERARQAQHAEGAEDGMRTEARYTVSTRDVRRARVREIALDILAGLAWLAVSALIAFICCAASGYHWE